MCVDRRQLGYAVFHFPTEPPVDHSLDAENVTVLGTFTEKLVQLLLLGRGEPTCEVLFNEVVKACVHDDLMAIDFSMQSLRILRKR